MSGPARPVRVNPTRSWRAGALIAPLLVVAVGVVAGLWLAPQVRAKGDVTDFGQFFGTAAQVIAALLITLAIEARSLPLPTLYRHGPALVATVIYVAAGEVAAVAALSPRLPHGLYAPLFGATVGGGFGALGSVLALGVTLVRKEASEEEAKRLEEVAETIRRLGGGDL